MNPLRRLLWRINGRPRLRAPEVEAAARAKRALAWGSGVAFAKRLPLGSTQAR